MAERTLPGSPKGRDALRKEPVEDLIARMRAGDPDARDELLRRYKPSVDAWATRHVGTGPGFVRPSDIAQDTAQRVLQGFETFRGATEGELLAWLKSIVLNCIQESRRFAHRQKRDEGDTLSLDDPAELPTPNPGESPSQIVSRHEAQVQLLAHLSQLPPAQREAIWLCGLKDISVAEAARRMKRTQGAVGGLLQRGIKALRSRMIEGAAVSSVKGSTKPASRKEVVAALVMYLGRRSAGQIAPRDAFLAEHPGCAEELRSLLDWINHMQAIWAESSDSTA